MKSFGSINISNSYIENIINNYSVADTKEEKKSNEEEAEGANHSEVVEVQPVPTKELVEKYPDYYDLYHRPDFLLVKARKI